MNSSIVANLKHAFGATSRDLVSTGKMIIASKLKFLSKINFFLVSGEPICPGVLCWPLGMIAWLHMIEYMIAYDVFYCMLTCVALDFHAHLKGTCFTKKNSNRTETHKIEALQHSNLSSI